MNSFNAVNAEFSDTSLAADDLNGVIEFMNSLADDSTQSKFHGKSWEPLTDVNWWVEHNALYKAYLIAKLEYCISLYEWIHKFCDEDKTQDDWHDEWKDNILTNLILKHYHPVELFELPAHLARRCGYMGTMVQDGFIPGKN